MTMRKVFMFSPTLALNSAWLMLVLLALPQTSAATERRVALLIGNSHYHDGLPVSGREDAEAMAKTLGLIGFNDVTTLPDADLDTMKESRKPFEKAMKDAKVVLFFYAGHGFHLGTESYLMPVDGSAHPAAAIRLSDVLQSFAQAPADAVKLVILDACRTSLGLDPNQTGLAEPQSAPKGVIQAFATSPGEAAPNGGADSLSPYTSVLIRHLAEPGIDLLELFSKVHEEVAAGTKNSNHPLHPQFPTLQLPKIPKFYLSPPARIEARVEVADDDLIVFLDDKLALNHQTQGVLPKDELRKQLELKSGKNKLTVLVSNQKTLRNGLPWERTNGWGYALRLIGPDGHELTSPECGGQDPCFSGGEEVPFKDGPHHGKTFVVATATLFVDPTSGTSPRVSLQDVKTDLWKNGENSEISGKIPFWAKDQKLLYAVSLTRLPLGIAVAGNLQEIFDMIVKNVLEVQKNVPEPNKIYGVVRGNAALEEFVAPCIEGPDHCDERMQDFKQSLDAARNGNPKPFDGFVKRLTECIRKRAGQKPGFTTRSEDILVWTAFEDWTSEPNQPLNQGFSGGQACRLGPSPAESQDALLQIPAHGLRIGPLTFRESLRGVPLALRGSAFLSFKPTEKNQFLFSARIVADLSDLQKKISNIIDTVPLPSDNCARHAVDNLVPRILEKEITLEGEVATLRLAGELDVWACDIALHCRLLGCHDVMKTKIESTFEMQIPVHFVVAASNTAVFAVGDPQVNIRGIRDVDRLAETILRAVGVDIEGKAKAALKRAIGPDLLKMPLPTELQRLDPTFTRAAFFNNSGALATSLEMTATVDGKGLLGLIKLFKPAQEGSP